MVLCITPLLANAQWEKVGYHGTPGYIDWMINFDSRIFISCGYNIYCSTDDGDSWQIFSDGLRRSFYLTTIN